jgi:hypothetical protein
MENSGITFYRQKNSFLFRNFQIFTLGFPKQLQYYNVISGLVTIAVSRKWL